MELIIGSACNLLFCGVFVKLSIKKIHDSKHVKVNMSDDDYKDTWKGFTKFVLWGTIAIIGILVILALTLL